MSILVRQNFNNLYYSDSEEVNSDSDIQYYKYVCNKHELRDLCNLYNKNSELVEISWPDQTSVNSQRTSTSAFTAASVTISQSKLINNNDNKLLNMVDMLISIACSKISCCRAWLRINEHQEENFRINKMMQTINEEMLNTEKTLINPFWRLNSEEEGWLYTDKKRFECDWMIQYLLNICKFTVTASFLLSNLSSAVIDNALSVPSVKSVRNVVISRVLCRVVHNRQTHKVWKNAKKIIKYQVLAEHIVYLAIRDTDFKIIDQSENSS